MYKTINDEILNKEMKLKNIPIIIKFWTEWCASCKVLNNTIKQIKNLFKKKIKIIKINVDLNYYSSERFSVKNVPTIIIIKNKTIISKKQGFITKEYLKRMIGKLIK